MTKTVSAAEANRQFSRLLREIGDGHSYVVTSHGRPVARIVPFKESMERKEASKARLLARLERQRAIDIGPWKREDLYEDVG
jgi:prevent-host-death family protein